MEHKLSPVIHADFRSTEEEDDVDGEEDDFGRVKDHARSRDIVGDKLETADITIAASKLHRSWLQMSERLEGQSLFQTPMKFSGRAKSS